MRKRIIAAATVLSCILSLFSGISVSAAEKNYSSVRTGSVDGENVIINIDFKVLKGQKYDYALRFFDDGNAAGTPFGAIRFNKDGRVLIHSDARHWNQEWMGSADYYSIYQKATFEEDVVYNLKARLDREMGIVEYFLDDKWIGKSTGTPNGTWWTITSVGESGYSDGFEWTVNSVVAADRGEMGAEISEVDDKKVKVVFSETPVDSVNFSNMALVNTNEAAVEGNVEITGFKQNGAAIDVSFSGDLRPGCEYVLILPENIEGTLGGKMSGNHMYFTAPAQTETVVSNIDFETEGSSIKVVGATYPYAETAVRTENGKDGGYGLTVKSGDIVGDKPSSTVAMNWDGFTVPDADAIAVSFDILPLRSDLSFVTRFLTADDNAKTPIIAGLTQKGKIVGGYVFDIYQILQGDDSWWNNRMVRGSYAQDEWVNIKIEWDNLRKTGVFYIDGTPTSVTTSGYELETKASAYSGIDHVRMYLYQNLMGVTEAGTDLFVLDNIKTSIIENPLLVNKVRFKDFYGKTTGACDTVSRLLDSVDVFFNETIDTDTLGNSISLTYDGVPIECTTEYNPETLCCTLIPSVLPKANTRIEVSVSGTSDEEGIKTVQPYIGAVTAAAADDELTAEEFCFAANDGTAIEALDSGDVYIKAAIANTTDAPKEIIVSAMGYEDAALCEFDYQVVTVGANTMYVIDEKNINPITLSVDSADSVCAVLQNREDGYPLTERIYLEKRPGAEGKLSITGSVKDAEENSDVVIEVYAPGKSFEDLSSAADFRDVLIYKIGTKTAEDSSWNTEFSVDYENAKSGMYTVIAAAKGYLCSDKLLYVNPAETRSVLNDILNPAINRGDIDEIGSVLFENHYALYVDDKYISRELANKAAAIIVNFSEENTLTEMNVKTVINKAIAIAGINDGVITDITGEPEIFDLDNSKLKDVYKADYVTDKTNSDIVKRMRIEKCATISDFDEMLTEKFVLSVVANPVRPGSVAAVSKLVGLTGYSSEAYSGVANKEYTDISELKKALDGYRTSGSSGSGGGASGSGGGSGGNYQVSNSSGASAPMPSNSDNTDVSEIFSDMDGYEWAKDYVIRLYNKGIVSGTGAGLFEPGRSVNREEFVKLLCEAFGYGAGNTAIAFDDVAETDWYASYVSRAVELGMVKGISETVFGSGTPISREDMAVIIYRVLAAENMKMNAIDTNFTDESEIADYAKEAVKTLAGIGIINGVGEGRFAPKAEASRAEAAVIILRCIDNFSL